MTFPVPRHVAIETGRNKLTGNVFSKCTYIYILINKLNRIKQIEIIIEGKKNNLETLW